MYIMDVYICLVYIYLRTWYRPRGDKNRTDLSGPVWEVYLYVYAYNIRLPSLIAQGCYSIYWDPFGRSARDLYVCEDTGRNFCNLKFNTENLPPRRRLN